ncbi:helix-turn-helix domain-containing protein [Streptomyces anulatus]|uniref:helix-turn-helix domain-containing protein n=1 Tax=Streptomyces anulatus TaxID=1892 RepID=UPI00225A99FA|nr:helix-turn-helix domain-containing protein [Streptomyces anulatus]MCX4523974.1 helix-turn-helix domain-containing protein [Streptomyces anulatus]WSU78989.1 helix-turn-helix domain-containing protein [Streptomyces anulatus]
MSSTEQHLRVTVAALMYATGEDQRTLATGLELTQPQISRKQSGRAAWSLTDLDRLAAHYGMAPIDLLSGADHAVSRLPEHRRAAVIGGVQTMLAG